MRIRVLYFAAAREAAGTGDEEVTIGGMHIRAATIADALSDAVARHPGLAAVLPSCRTALDQEFAPRTTPLRDGCTLAVLPPVSGG